MAKVQFLTANNGLEIVVKVCLYFALHMPQQPMRTMYSYRQVAELLKHVTKVQLNGLETQL